MLFHLVIVVGNLTKWIQVLKVKYIPQAVLNPVYFDNQGNIIEDYDLQGLTISSVDNNWAPFHMMGPCEGNLCKATGKSKT